MIETARLITRIEDDLHAKISAARRDLDRADAALTAGEAITALQSARDVESLHSTSNATRADEQRLAQFVLRSRFRPRVTNGQLTDSDQIVVRYYLGE